MKLHSDEAQTITLHVKGDGKFTAGDIKLPTQVSVMNPELHILTATEKGADFTIEMRVEKGLGYVPKENLHKDRIDVGTIALDGVFTPIRRVNYETENMRVGDRTDFNRLRISIETDGTVTPHEVLESSIHTMITQLQSIVGFRAEVVDLPKEAKQAPIVDSSDSLDLTDASKVKIEDLGLSTRTENALVAASIRTAGGLTRKSEEDLLATDGLGEKGITEIKKALSDLGLTLKA